MRNSILLSIICYLSLITPVVSNECPCTLTERPDKSEKALTARWMVHSLDWGTLSTISTRVGSANIPFGNIYSFVDGPCHNSTGIPYFYGTYLDQSLEDSLENPMVSLSLTEASLSAVCANKQRLDSCTLGTQYGDPENPVCARLTITGELVFVDMSSPEYEFGRTALFQRHPTMSNWPNDHHWVVFKIDIQDIWLIDYFGGASIISVGEYLEATLPADTKESL